MAKKNIAVLHDMKDSTTILLFLRLVLKDIFAHLKMLVNYKLLCSMQTESNNLSLISMNLTNFCPKKFRKYTYIVKLDAIVLHWDPQVWGNR